MAAVEIDVGTGTDERILLGLADDPVAVAQRFCDAQGFPEQIMLPLAVKLAEAQDKAASAASASPKSPSASPARTGRALNPAAPSFDVHGTAGAERSAANSPRSRPATAAASRSTAPSEERGTRPASARLSVAPRSKNANANAKNAHHAWAPKTVWGGGPGVRVQQKAGPKRAAKKTAAESDEDRPRGEIFDRLYASAMRKKEEEKALERRRAVEEEAEAAAARVKRTPLMSRASAELTRGRTAGEYSSYNERLYAEASQRREAKNEAVARAAREREQRETEELKDRPSISEYAAGLVRSEAPWQRLSQGYKDAKAEQLAQIKEEMDRKALAECTFRPKINAKSKDLMRSRVGALRDRGVTHHDQLFYDANRRRMRQEEYEAWQPPDHTFHPNAHRSAAHHTGGPHSLSSSMDGGASLQSWNLDGELPPRPVGQNDAWAPPVVNHAAVVERLVASQRRSQQHKERLADEIYGRFGRPQVGRAPSFPRNPAQLPIHDLLYANRHEFDDKKELIQMRDQERLAEEASASHVTGKSKGLVDALKRRKFRTIFRALDSGDTGTVDLREVDLNRLRSVGSASSANAIASARANTNDGSRNGSRAASPTPPVNVNERTSGAVSNGRGESSSLPSDSQLREMTADVRAAAALCPGPVGVEGFIAAMEAVLETSKTGPRTYFASRAGSRNTKAEAAVAAVAAIERANQTAAERERTKRLAAAKREKMGVQAEAPYYEKLIAEGAATRRRLEELAKNLEEEEMSQCTFFPQTLKTRPKSRRPLVSSGPGGAEGNGWSAADAGGGAGMTPGEKRYADLERELEAVLALDMAGNDAPMNAESLAALLSGAGGGGGALPDLSSDED